MTEGKYTKIELIEKVNTDRRRLEQNLEKINSDMMLLPGAVGKWSIKDVLAHLANWEELYMDWLAATRSGETMEIPGHGSTWNNLDPLNQFIYEQHCCESLEIVLAYFHAMHQAFMKQLEAMRDEELFTPGFYTFTGKGRLENWYVAFAEHDRWAKTEVRRWLKEKAAKEHQG